MVMCYVFSAPNYIFLGTTTTNFWGQPTIIHNYFFVYIGKFLRILFSSFTQETSAEPIFLFAGRAQCAGRAGSFAGSCFLRGKAAFEKELHPRRKYLEPISLSQLNLKCRNNQKKETINEKGRATPEQI